MPAAALKRVPDARVRDARRDRRDRDSLARASRCAAPRRRRSRRDAPDDARDAHDATRPVDILLVDDRPENLLALEAILEPLGQTLVRAQSGEEALRSLLDARLRGDPARRADAGHERLRDGAADQVARAHALHPDHLPHRDQQGRGVRLRGLLGRRGRLHVQAVPAGHPALEGHGVRRPVSASSAQHRASRSSCCARASGASSSCGTCASCCESEARFREIVELGDGRDRRASTPTARSRSSTPRPSGCSARRRATAVGQLDRALLPRASRRDQRSRSAQRDRRASATSAARRRRRAARTSFTGASRERRDVPDRGVGVAASTRATGATYTLIVRDVSERVRARGGAQAAGDVARASRRRSSRR